MRIRPINSLVSSFMFSNCMYDNDGLDEKVNLNEVYKVCHFEEQYDYRKGGVFFLWDSNSNLYLFNDTTFSWFGSKEDFGTINYHFTEIGNGYFVGLSFYVGRYFISNMWKLTGDLYLDYSGNPTSFNLKKAITIPAYCLLSKDELLNSSLSDYQFFTNISLNEEFDVSYVPTEKLLENPCYEQLNNSSFNITLSYANVFTLDYIIREQKALFDLASNYSYLDVVNYRVIFSYPYKIELLDDLKLTSKLNWENYPDLYVEWFAGYPIYQRETLVSPVFYTPTALLFAGGGLVGLTTGMAIDSITFLTGAMLNTMYELYQSSHSTLYSSPCSNFTDFAVSDIKTNLFTLAPGLSLYVGTFEPNIGFYIAGFKNMDSMTQQSTLKREIGKWYVSTFPIDNLQQQFPDEYLTFDYPVYTKIVFNVTEESYNTDNINWIYPLDKSCLEPIVGIVPIQLNWSEEYFKSNLQTDHYGNIPINNLISDINEKYVTDIDWTKYNPNKWFVGKLETITYTDSSDTSVLVKKNISSDFVIPLGVSVDRPILESILNIVIDDINQTINQYTSNKKQPPLKISSNNQLLLTFYFLLLLNDGNLIVSPNTVTFKDTINSLFNYRVNGEYHELWWYIGSFYQPGEMVLSKPILKYTPGANFPKVSTYRTLSHNVSNYNIKIFKGVLKVEYEIEFNSVTGYNLVGVSVGSSGVPIIGIYKDKDNKTEVHLLKSIKINATPISIDEIYSQLISGVTLSYSKIASDGEYVYWYFGDKLYKLDPDTKKITIGYLNTDEFSLENSSQKPSGVRLLADFIEFVNSDVKDSLFKTDIEK